MPISANSLVWSLHLQFWEWFSSRTTDDPRNVHEERKKKDSPRRTSAGMSLLNVLGRSSSFFSSAAKTIAATSNRTGTNFMISTMTRTEREEGESRPSVPLKRKEKKRIFVYSD